MYSWRVLEQKHSRPIQRSGVGTWGWSVVDRSTGGRVIGGEVKQVSFDRAFGPLILDFVFSNYSWFCAKWARKPLKGFKRRNNKILFIFQWLYYQWRLGIEKCISRMASRLQIFPSCNFPEPSPLPAWLNKSALAAPACQPTMRCSPSGSSAPFHDEMDRQVLCLAHAPPHVGPVLLVVPYAGY